MDGVRAVDLMFAAGGCASRLVRQTCQGSCRSFRR